MHNCGCPTPRARIIRRRAGIAPACWDVSKGYILVEKGGWANVKQEAERCVASGPEYAGYDFYPYLVSRISTGSQSSIGGAVRLSFTKVLLQYSLIASFFAFVRLSVFPEWRIRASMERSWRSGVRSFRCAVVVADETGACGRTSFSPCWAASSGCAFLFDSDRVAQLDYEVVASGFSNGAVLEDVSLSPSMLINGYVSALRWRYASC